MEKVAISVSLLTSYSWRRKVCFNVLPSTAPFNLRSAAIDYLDEVRKRRPRDSVAICHFYFKYDDKERQTREQVTRNLLSQIAYQLDVVPPSIFDALENLYLEGKTGLAPKHAIITDLFISCSNFLDSTFVFFDGLDECTKDTQKKVVDLIRRFCASDIRVFLTSQPHLIPLVTASIDGAQTIEMVADKGDLKNFILEKFDSAGSKEGLDGPLVEKLVSGAEGT
jgi:hypothetical protein